MGDGEPEFIVDASGRRRLAATLLGLPFETGPRRDTALHAHLEGVNLIQCGNVHTDVLETGWSWRIPLPGRVSVGFVVNGETLSKFGNDIEEQFDNYLAYDPVIRRWGGSPRRITPVVKYTNYQLVSGRGSGPNWALVGDAFGFVDPVFSSGMLIGLDGAEELAKTLVAGPSPELLSRYEAHVRHHILAWQRVVGHFYSGRLFTLLHVAEIAKTTRLGRVLDLHFGRYLPRVFTGEASNGRYGVWLLDFMCRNGLARNDPTPLAVN
jgi:flavin-dependent dehydrogenase